MNRLFGGLRFLCCVLYMFACGVSAWGSIDHLLPIPKHVRYVGGEGFVLNGEVLMNCPDDSLFVQMLTDWLSEEGLRVLPYGTVGCHRSVCVRKLSGSVGSVSDEWYRLLIQEDGVLIECVSHLGVARAISTLRQLCAGGVEFLECVEIIDYPSFSIRGWMHDVGRSYLSMEELKREIRLLSYFKVNYLHLHLSEDIAWRFSVPGYPCLTEDTVMLRDKGRYYSRSDCEELSLYALRYGVTLIPELDMPGHSGAFKRAMGFDMESDSGRIVLRTALRALCDAFPYAPYIHLGGDEVVLREPSFMVEMIDYVHALGRKAAVWMPSCGDVSGTDLCFLWSSAGRALDGVSCVDCRYHYLNHFDVFGDVAGIFRSNIYYRTTGDSLVLGSVSAVWNDHVLENETAIVRQNNLYASVIASASRGWTGGGRQYIEQGGAVLPYSGAEYEEFADWERRFLYHKSHVLRDVDVPYVRQSDICWTVSEAFENGGSPENVFPPEKDELLGNGASSASHGYTTYQVRGGGVYLRHTWGGIVPGLFGDIGLNHTAYAWTNVYSPCNQEVGALIEFQNYSRSEADSVPASGRWDRKGSRIWLNGEELIAPSWSQADRVVDRETALSDENFTGRTPYRIYLRKGWNRIFLKLPYVSCGIRLNKWMFTFVLTDVDGVSALDGIRYDCDDVCSEAESAVHHHVRSD